MRAAGRTRREPPDCGKERRPDESRAAAEMQPVVERLARIHRRTGRACGPRLRREAEADMVKLAIAIARRVIRRETGGRPGGAARAWCMAALEKLQAQEICRVRVHPSQARLIAALLRKSGAAASADRSDRRSVRANRARWSSRPQRGNLDASVESQLGEIERGLADRLRRRNMSGAISLAPYLSAVERMPAAAVDGTGHAGGGTAGRIARAGRGDRRFLRDPDRQRAAHPDAGDRLPRRAGALDAAGGDRRAAARRSGGRRAARMRGSRWGRSCSGRVIDGFGKPMDGGPPIEGAGALQPVRGAAQPARARAHYGAARHGHPRHRRPAALRQRAAHRDLRRQRRGQEHAARLACRGTTRRTSRSSR